jgi:hypothetical protein
MQWVSTKSPRPKKAQKVQSNVEVMLTVFSFVVHNEFVCCGQMVNKDYLKAVRRRGLICVGGKKWLLQHDILWCILPF